MAKFSAFGTLLKAGDKSVKVITNVVLSAGTTYTFTSASHGFTNGQSVTLVGFVPAGWNVTAAVANATANTFDLNVGSNPAGPQTVGYASLANVYTTVAQVRTIGGPTLSGDTIDVTTHDSAGAWREFVAGLIDAGEVSFELVFDPDSASQQGVRNDLANRERMRSYQLVFPDATATTYTFYAVSTAFEPDAPVDGDLSASATLKLTGAPTLT